MGERLEGLGTYKVDEHRMTDVAILCWRKTIWGSGSMDGVKGLQAGDTMARGAEDEGVPEA